MVTNRCEPSFILAQPVNSSVVAIILKHSLVIIIPYYFRLAHYIVWLTREAMIVWEILLDYVQLPPEKTGVG
jgi:hypothetical protein